MMHDVAVLGAGPAGMAAATEAAARGARTVLLEESPLPGGQVYRAPPPGFVVPADPGPPRGDALRAALAASGRRCAGCRVWGLGGGPLVPQGQARCPSRSTRSAPMARPSRWTARALVLCPGTHERIIPFPGWTLPGVIGLAAATILLKAQGVLPGGAWWSRARGRCSMRWRRSCCRRGRGRGGVGCSRPRRMARALPALAARPDLLARGAAWRAKLLRRGRAGAARRASRHGGGRGTGARVRVRVDGGKVEASIADALCIGHGLVPATEATRTFRARHATPRRRMAAGCRCWMRASALQRAAALRRGRWRGRARRGGGAGRRAARRAGGAARPRPAGRRAARWRPWRRRLRARAAPAQRWRA
jgi:hypothetical protein